MGLTSMDEPDLVRDVLAAGEDGLECPLCGGGRIYDITEAIETAQQAGTVLVPLPPQSERTS